MRRGLAHVSALAAVLALTSACATSAPATGTSADETAIRGIGGKYSEAFNKGDAAALAALVADDYLAVLPDGTIIKGRAAFQESEKQEVAKRAGLPLTLNIQTSNVDWITGSAAVAAGTWSLAGLPPGLGSGKGSWVATVRKGDDGQWRLWRGLVAEHVEPAPSLPAPEAGKGK
jgi:uncharacterized protein (TIGR02246 family)